MIISARDGQFYIKKEALPEDLMKKYRNELSYILPRTESKFQQAAVSVWTEIKGFVRLPRMLGIRDFPGKYKNKLPELPILDAWKPAQEYLVNTLSHSLFDYQQEAIDKFTQQYCEGINLGGIVKFGCGRGKTRTALCCAATLGKKTLVICNGDTPCNSFVQEIEKSFPSENAFPKEKDQAFLKEKDQAFLKEKTTPKYVLLTQLKKNERKSALKDPSIPIVISCYKTIIYPGNFEPEDFNLIDLVIMDELHEYLTPKSVEIYNFISRRFILGLSATPTKPNGLHFLLDYFVGPILIECQNLYKGALPIIEKHYFDVDGIEFEKGEPYQKVQEKIQSAQGREDLIVSQVIKHYQNPENRILVIGIMRSLLEKYKSSIESVLGSDTCALYYAVNTKTEKLERDKQIQERRIVLAIRQMGGQSLNIPDLNIMILASKYIPKNEGENTEKIEQLMGRVMRKNHTCSPIVIDIVDRHFFFLKHDRLCADYYKKCGYTVIASGQKEDIQVEEFEVIDSIEDEYL